jgi:hypothetical protein
VRDHLSPLLRLLYLDQHDQLYVGSPSCRPTSHAWQVLAVPPATSRGEYRALNAAFACTRPL